MSAQIVHQSMSQVFLCKSPNQALFKLMICYCCSSLFSTFDLCLKNLKVENAHMLMLNESVLIDK